MQHQALSQHPLVVTFGCLNATQGFMIRLDREPPASQIHVKFLDRQNNGQTSTLDRPVTLLPRQKCPARVRNRMEYSVIFLQQHTAKAYILGITPCFLRSIKIRQFQDWRLARLAFRDRYEFSCGTPHIILFGCALHVKSVRGTAISE